jgi:hypothetical protein
MNSSDRSASSAALAVVEPSLPATLDHAPTLAVSAPVRVNEMAAVQVSVTTTTTAEGDQTTRVELLQVAARSIEFSDGSSTHEEHRRADYSHDPAALGAIPSAAALLDGTFGPGGLPPGAEGEIRWRLVEAKADADDYSDDDFDDEDEHDLESDEDDGDDGDDSDDGNDGDDGDDGDTTGGLSADGYSTTPASWATREPVRAPVAPSSGGGGAGGWLPPVTSSIRRDGLWASVPDVGGILGQLGLMKRDVEAHRQKALEALRQLEPLAQQAFDAGYARRGSEAVTKRLQGEAQKAAQLVARGLEAAALARKEEQSGLRLAGRAVGSPRVKAALDELTALAREASEAASEAERLRRAFDEVG